RLARGLQAGARAVPTLIRQDGHTARAHHVRARLRALILEDLERFPDSFAAGSAPRSTRRPSRGRSTRCSARARWAPDGWARRVHPGCRSLESQYNPAPSTLEPAARRRRLIMKTGPKVQNAETKKWLT